MNIPTYMIVYRGTYIGTTVAIKVLPYKINDLDEVKEKFKNEVKVLRYGISISKIT